MSLTQPNIYLIFFFSPFLHQLKRTQADLFYCSTSLMTWIKTTFFINASVFYSLTEKKKNSSVSVKNVRFNLFALKRPNEKESQKHIGLWWAILCEMKPYLVLRWRSPELKLKLFFWHAYRFHSHEDPTQLSNQINKYFNWILLLRWKFIKNQSERLSIEFTGIYIPKKFWSIQTNTKL